MLNAKEMLLNNVLVAMRVIIDATAMQMLQQIMTKELQRVEIVERETLPATVNNTNEYIINLFMARKAPKLSVNTVEQYINAVKSLIDTAQKPLLQMTTMDIEYFLQCNKAKGNSNVSVNNMRRHVSAFFTWMRKSKLIMDNPCEQIEPWKEIEKPIDHMEPEEVELLKTGCHSKRDRALIEFLRCTAMRREEIPEVKIKDIDWQTGKIVIFGQKSQSYRLVCLDSVAMHYLREYLQERGVSQGSPQAVFTHIRGDKSVALSKDGVYSVIKTIAERAGMERRVYPHLFRKTTATNVIRRGGSEEAAGEYLGHKPRTVTGRHYAYKSEDHVISIFRQYVASV
jgi:integrase/recombinase XerD